MLTLRNHGISSDEANNFLISYSFFTQTLLSSAIFIGERRSMDNTKTNRPAQGQESDKARADRGQEQGQTPQSGGTRPDGAQPSNDVDNTTK